MTVADAVHTFTFPTRVRCGPGALAEMHELLQTDRVTRPLVITDPALVETDAFARLRSVLDEAGRSWALTHDIQPNPTAQNVADVVNTLRAEKCDGLIAIGGGSAMDAGKMARVLANRADDRLMTMTVDESECDGLPPMVCIPTTAGTGSEVGRSAVISVEEDGGHVKKLIGHPALMPDRVVLEPRLTINLPAGLTAATGADALTHCVESFTAPQFHPMCDGIALEGVTQVVNALPRVMEARDDVEARMRMQVAAMMGAVAFQKDLGAAHSMAHPLSAVCGMHHGLANALCLPPVMRFNADRRPGLYRRIGLACGLPVTDVSAERADGQTIEFVTRFLRDLGVAGGLSEHGVRDDQIERLVAQAVGDVCHQTNPVPVGEDDFRELFREAL